MRKDYQKFICDHCGRTFIMNRDDVECNPNELEIFDVTDRYDTTKEFCSAECALNALSDFIVTSKALGRRVGIKIESYKYEYEHEEKADE